MLTLRWTGAAAAAAALAALLVYAARVWHLKRRCARLCGRYVYTLPQLPLLGNAHTLAGIKDTTGLWHFITDLAMQHRQGVLYWVFHLNWIFLQELDVVEAVLMSPDACDKSYVYSLLHPITDGVFSCNGVRWRKLRRKLNVTLSQKQMERFSDHINSQARVCVDVLRGRTDRDLNIQAFLAPYFVDVIFRTHFGMGTEEQVKRKYQITECAAKIIELTMEKRFFNVFIHPKAVFKLSRLYGVIAALRAAPLAFIRKTIGRRMIIKGLDKNAGSVEALVYADLVQDLLPELDLPVTPYHLERNTSDVIVAASDTTSVTVSACLYYLALHQDVQERVFQETLEVYGQELTRDLTRQDLGRLQYLEMVIKETLRLTAPPGIVRELTQDMDVGKYVLPKGINTYIVMKAIHENPEYWEKPTQFYPEHFLPEACSTRPKFAFIPFSMGPRNCPGMAYSYITMKTIVSSIVRNFRLNTNVPLESIKFKMAIMQEPECGFTVALSPR